MNLPYFSEWLVKELENAEAEHKSLLAQEKFGGATLQAVKLDILRPVLERFEKSLVMPEPPKKADE